MEALLFFFFFKVEALLGQRSTDSRSRGREQSSGGSLSDREQKTHRSLRFNVEDALKFKYLGEIQFQTSPRSSKVTSYSTKLML